MAKKYKVGLIGYGTIGQIHSKIIQENNSFDLIAISDLQQPVISPDINYYEDYKKLLSEEPIDTISIATPPDSHFAIAKHCLSANKHVLIEKPPTIYPERLEELVKLARSKNKILFTAFHMRYNPAVIKAAEVLKDKNIIKIEVDFKEYVFNFHDPDRWIFDHKISGGGILMDSGTNVLSVIKKVLNNKFDFKLNEIKLTNDLNSNIETKVDIKFTINGGIKARLKMDWLYKDEDIRLLDFYTPNNKYTVNINKGTVSNNGEIIFKFSQPASTMMIEYQGVYKHYLQALTGNELFVSKEEVNFVNNVYKLSQKI